MSAVAYEPYAPRAAGFWAVLWRTFVGFVLAAVALVPAVVGLLVLGVVGRDTVTHEAYGPLDWPWRHSGAWSVVANAVVTLAAIAITTLIVRAAVASRVDDRVSLPRTFAILVVTGYAPYIAYRGVLPLGFVVALPVSAYLIKRFAIGHASPRLSHRARLAAVASIGAALLVAATYGLTHPLWYSGVVEATGAKSGFDWNAHRVVYAYRPGATVRYGMVVSNGNAFADATVVSVSGGSRAFRVVEARVGVGPAPWFPTSPLRGRLVFHRGDQDVTLFLRIGRCRPGPAATLDRVTFRYRMYGLTFSEPVALAIRPTLFCRG